MKANILRKKRRHPHACTALRFPDDWPEFLRGVPFSQVTSSPRPPASSPAAGGSTISSSFSTSASRSHHAPARRPTSCAPRQLTAAHPHPLKLLQPRFLGHRPAAPRQGPPPSARSCRSPAVPAVAQQPLSLETPEASPQQSSSLFIFLSRLHPLSPPHQPVVLSAPVLSFDKTKEAGERPFPQCLLGLIGLPRGRGADPRSLPTFIYVCIYIYLYYGKICRA